MRLMIKNTDQINHENTSIAFNCPQYRKRLCVAQSRVPPRFVVMDVAAATQNIQVIIKLRKVCMILKDKNKEKHDRELTK